jgi:hypothetical protein
VSTNIADVNAIASLSTQVTEIGDDLALGANSQIRQINANPADFATTGKAIAMAIVFGG